MGFFPESEAELARQITHALSDQSFDPLDEVHERAPEDCHYFSDMESRLSEWSFACGIAWALVRMRDPFAPAERVVDSVQRLARDGWRAHAGPQSWTELVREDRDERGQVKRDPQNQLEGFSEGLGKVTVRRSESPEASRPSR
jgi:hypothetical protein